MLIAPNGTGYSTVARADGTYGVEVVTPGDLPEMIRGFASEGEAERWILTKLGQGQPGNLPNITTAAHNL